MLLLAVQAMASICLQTAGNDNQRLVAMTSTCSQTAGNDHRRIVACMERIAVAEEVLASVRGALANICGTEPLRSYSSPVEELASMSGSRTEPAEKTGSRVAAASLASSPVTGSTLDMTVQQGENSIDVNTFTPPRKSSAVDVYAKDFESTNPDVADQNDAEQIPPDHEHHVMNDIYDQVLLTAVYEEILEDQEPKENDEAKRTGSQQEIEKLERAFGCGEGLVEVDDEDEVSAEEDKLKQEPRIVLEKSCNGVLTIPLIHPENGYLLMWDGIGALLLLYLSFYIPVRVAFDVEASGFLGAVLFAANMYFMCDILVNFITGYRDSDGNLVMDFTQVRRRYAQGWLALDMLAGIPWDWVGGGYGEGQLLKSVRIFRLTRIVQFIRLIRLMHGNPVKDKIDLLMEVNPVLVFLVGILRLLLLLLIVTHWCACTWYFVGTLNPGHSWIDVHLKDNPYLLEHYSWAVYFTLTTMTTVGYGDVVVSNFTEVCFVLALLVIASVVFAGLVGAFTALIDNFNKEAADIAEQKKALSKYMHWRNVPHGLFMTIRRHLLFMWETNLGFDEYENNVKDSLPPLLRKELNHHIFGSTLKMAPCFAWVWGHEGCLRELADLAQSMWLSRGDHLFRVGEQNATLHIVIMGSVLISLNEHVAVHPLACETSEKAGSLNMVLGSHSRRYSHNSGHIPHLVLKGMVSKEHARSDHEHSKLEVKSHVLQNAWRELQSLDDKEKKAASHIQTRWRRMKLLKLLRGVKTLQRANANHKSSGPLIGSQAIHQLRSRVVQAPAFFGEACLWQPIEQWNTIDPPVYKYSARCDQRSELVMISRSAIQDLIFRYSPWLRERFEYFRKGVLSSQESSLVSLREHTHLTNLGCKDFDHASDNLEWDVASSISVGTATDAPISKALNSERPGFESSRKSSTRRGVAGDYFQSDSLPTGPEILTSPKRKTCCTNLMHSPPVTARSAWREGFSHSLVRSPRSARGELESALRLSSLRSPLLTPRADAHMTLSSF